jgi:hypothetical protein
MRDDVRDHGQFSCQGLVAEIAEVIGVEEDLLAAAPIVEDAR